MYKGMKSKVMYFQQTGKMGCILLAILRRIITSILLLSFTYKKSTLK